MSIGRHSAGLEPHSPPAAGPGAPSAEAVLAWTAARDAVLRGLVHALSNRVGTVAAVGGMLDGDPPPGSVGTAARVLAGEGERLETLLAHFRLATADPAGADAAPEPVHLGEVLAEAAALVDYSGVEVAAVVADGAPPAVVSRAGLVHALLVLAADRATRLVAEAGADGEVVVRVAGGRADAAALGAVRWLTGAPADADSAVVILRLSALGATREPS